MVNLQAVRSSEAGRQSLAVDVEGQRVERRSLLRADGGMAFAAGVGKVWICGGAEVGADLMT